MWNTAPAMEGPAELVRRAVGAASRRLERPELLAAFYPHAAQLLREEVAIGALLAGVLRSDTTFVDIGANRGQILREAVRLAPAGRHVAFEPIPALADELARSFPGVDCRRLALGASPGVAEFCHFTSLDGWSGLRRSPEISDERGRPEYIEVQVSTLDAELGERRPGVIKIDVEGAELDVLAGRPRGAFGREADRRLRARRGRRATVRLTVGGTVGLARRARLQDLRSHRRGSDRALGFQQEHGGDQLAGDAGSVRTGASGVSTAAAAGVTSKLNGALVVACSAGSPGTRMRIV